MEGILALVVEVWETAHLIMAERLGVERLLDLTTFLAVLRSVGVVGVVVARALVSEEVVAALADSVRVCLPDFGEGAVACLMAHRVLQMATIPYLELAFGGCAVDVCDAGLAILMAEEDYPTIVFRLLGPVVDCVPVLMVQSVEV